MFNYKGGPNYRDLFPQPPAPGSVPSCAEGGVLGVLPGGITGTHAARHSHQPLSHGSARPAGLIGTLQATEAIKVLLGAGETLSGRLMLYDAMNMCAAPDSGD